MKIGLPKLRLSRKLLIITLGVSILLGGTAAAALYFKSKELGLERAESVIGGECTDVLTMVQKTPSNRLWLRRFIRMENANGPDRVRTALRVAGLLAKKNAVDLIHVSVLDSRGPTLRSQMRARSIGAEVLIAMKPDMLPEMKSPAMASYYEGPVNDQGRYYGDKVVVDIDEIGKIMTAMRSIEEKPDCAVPASEKSKAEDKEGGDKKKNEAKKEKSAEEGEKPKEGNKESAKEDPKEPGSDEAPAKAQSFLDSVLGMVGLGGGEEAGEKEKAADASAAVAEEPADTTADGGEKAAEDAGTAKNGNDSPASTDAQGRKPAADAEAKGDKLEANADPASAVKDEGRPAMAEQNPDKNALAKMPVGD